MIERVGTVEEAIRTHVRPGISIMVGGFGRGGVPFTLLERLVDRAEEFRDLVLIKNDASEPHLGIGPLLAAGMVRKLVSTHVGLNPDFIERMNRGEIEGELVPQGIFAERIRAGGAGIPAILSDIGIDTELAEGKQRVTFRERELLVEPALRADLALICADIADRAGNAWFRGSNRNMCVPMATACDAVVVEAKEIVEIGAIEPENVHVPSAFVDMVVPAAPRRHEREGAS